MTDSRSGKSDRVPADGLGHNPKSAEWISIVSRAGLALALALAGCWLFLPDETPPSCRMLQPTDSSVVSGLFLVRAEATDSSGVELVEFFADGTSIGTTYSEPFEAQWDTRTLGNGTWHALWCRAEDLSGNEGFSDTVDVQVIGSGARDIFHGRFDLPSGYYWPVPFAAEAGDTAAGDFRISGSGVLSRFICLDEQNYQEFQAQRSYSALLEASNKTELAVRVGIPSNGTYYLVFLNTSGSEVTCWVRFSLE